MSRKLLLFWLLTGVSLFVFLQVCYPYLFFFNEQSQLFLAEAAFFGENLPKPGGLTLWLSELLALFFFPSIRGSLYYSHTIDVDSSCAG